ncbi:CaiB/BaiF CoA transferase family protein [Cupriavidus neocaledonicus]|uniref:L-carnitine dehydratase/bile acid-inducible protein F n=1 Tax=Cupriavidus neocaledonicus TaxID=1040979 RepID=A0A375HQ63_9BURK|nr:CaiB/BaiF CoA-transferase family protein [Cupriavidus neocaledonicus]SOZ39183.1 L-carnitine dehydratase/bile acid-inducible protein F [Cupriavidus neocaledonicus]SPD59146.1 L-carnitine dehydratase/bile acid-inducible protein F [Cupriavidus neocaledonicus]
MADTRHNEHGTAGRKGPLSRFTVLDASRVRAGPTAVRLFADMGARVIKLEIPPGAPGGDDMIGGRDHNRADYENLHRNKESLTLNMKTHEGVKILHELVRRADVFIENYRPDVKHRLGIGPDALRAINPRLVYASISGFGQDGPYAGWPGFDSIAQGMGGLMSVTGKPGEGPMRVGIPLADLCAGHFCAMGILTALLEREASGEGQWVQTSLLEAQIAMLDFQAAQWLLDGKVPEQTGNEHPLTVPTGVFATRDGYLNIAAIGQTMWKRLCEALEVPQLVDEPGLGSDPERVRNRDKVNAAIEAALRTRTTAEWTERLLKAGVPCGPIHRVDQVFADPQVKHLAVAWPMQHAELGDVALVGQPMRLSRYPRDLPPQPAPEQGANTDHILHELGYTAAQVDELRAAHIV